MFYIKTMDTCSEALFLNMYIVNFFSFSVNFLFMMEAWVQMQPEKFTFFRIQVGT